MVAEVIGWSYFPVFDCGMTFPPAISDRAFHKICRRENLVGPPIRFKGLAKLLARSIVGFKSRSIPLDDDVGKVERVNEEEREGRGEQRMRKATGRVKLKQPRGTRRRGGGQITTYVTLTFD